MCDKKNSGGLISVVLLVISAVLILFISEIIGLILTIVTLVYSARYLKQKSIVDIIAFIVSIALIVYFATDFVYSANTVNSVVSEAQKKADQACEASVESDATMYVINNNLSNNTGTKYYSMDQISSSCSSCDGYVLVDFDNYDYKAYVKCDAYTSDGFDQTILDGLK